MAINDTDYASLCAVTDVVNAGTKLEPTAVDNNGMSQGALYTLMNTIITNWNTLMAKLETDGANSSYTPEYLLTTMASRGLSATGMNQSDLVAALYQMETNFNAVVAALDADTQVTKTDYSTIAAAAGSGAALNLNDTVYGSKGLSQDIIVSFLDDLVAKINAVLANLDIDAL